MWFLSLDPGDHNVELPMMRFFCLVPLAPLFLISMAQSAIFLCVGWVNKKKRREGSLLDVLPGSSCSRCFSPCFFHAEKHKDKKKATTTASPKAKDKATTQDKQQTKGQHNTQNKTQRCLSESSTCLECRGKRRNSEHVVEQIQHFLPPVHPSFHVRLPLPFLPLPLKSSAASATTTPLMLRTPTPAVPRPSAKESATTLASTSAHVERSAPSKRVTHLHALVSQLIAVRRRRATPVVMTSAPSASLTLSTRTPFCALDAATSSIQHVSQSGFRTDGQETLSVSAGLTVLFVTRRWAILFPVAVTMFSSEMQLSSERRSCRDARPLQSQSLNSRQ